MASVDAVKGKIQRLLTNEFGTVKVDKDGDFVIQHESSVVFISVYQWGDDKTIVKIQAPMVVDVKITPELTRWVAIDGQRFVLGRAVLNPDKDEKTGWIYFQQNLLGDDLDESELMEALAAIVITSNKLDNELRDKFGGELFGPDNQ